MKLLTRRQFSGKEIIKTLQKFGFYKDRQKGSHVILKYTHPKTAEKRTVVVPLHDEIKTGTLQNIADQAGANDFEEFCKCIERNI